MLAISGWWQYDERTCMEIEEAFKKGEKYCTILVAGYVYVVDFETMLQQRQNEPTRKRQVKRDLATIPKKGVAGLRIDGTTEHSSNSNNSSTPTGTNSGIDISSIPLGVVLANAQPNLITTIAATDAAIRIASDIIDSTLAHADDYRTGHSNDSSTDSRTSSNLSSSSAYNNYTNNSSAMPNRRDLLHEVEETLNISNASTASTSPNIDFFSSTIDEFRSLALTNIAETSSDEEDDNNSQHSQLRANTNNIL